MSFAIGRDSMDFARKFQKPEELQKLASSVWSDIAESHHELVRSLETLWFMSKDQSYVSVRNLKPLPNAHQSLLVGLTDTLAVAFSCSESKEIIEKIGNYFKNVEINDFSAYWFQELCRSEHKAEYQGRLRRLMQIALVDDNLRLATEKLLRDPALQTFCESLPLRTPGETPQNPKNNFSEFSLDRIQGNHILAIGSFISLKSPDIESIQNMWSFRLETCGYTSKKNFQWKSRNLIIQSCAEILPAFDLNSDSNILTVASMVNDTTCRLALYHLPEARDVFEEHECWITLPLENDEKLSLDELSCSSSFDLKYSALSFGSTCIIVDWSQTESTYVYKFDVEKPEYRVPEPVTISTIAFPLCPLYNVDSLEYSFICIGTSLGHLFKVNFKSGKLLFNESLNNRTPIRDIISSGDKLMALGVMEMSIFEASILQGRPIQFKMSRPNAIHAFGGQLASSNKFGTLSVFPLVRGAPMSAYPYKEESDKDTDFQAALNLYYRGTFIGSMGAMRVILYPNGQVRIYALNLENLKK